MHNCEDTGRHALPPPEMNPPAVTQQAAERNTPAILLTHANGLELPVHAAALVVPQAKLVSGPLPAGPSSTNNQHTLRSHQAKIR